MESNRKILVTIVTGFLGAGKTTFINSLLKKYTDTKFALVENEFGEISIDSKLIKGVDASRMFELKQGCICCTISGVFELILQELAEKFPNVEHLLIETTGIADPASVIRPFFVDENLKKIYQYNGSICLVDSTNFKNSPEKEITIKQLVVADSIVISKADNLSTQQKNEFAGDLKLLNPFADVQIFSLEKNEIIKLEIKSIRKKTEFDFVLYKVGHSEITSRSIQFSAPLNKNRFLDWLEYTLDIYKNQIYRTKGILCFENEPFEYILQGVGGSFEIVEGDLLKNEINSKIVFIGKLHHVKFDF